MEENTSQRAAVCLTLQGQMNPPPAWLTLALSRKLNPHLSHAQRVTSTKTGTLQPRQEAVLTFDLEGNRGCH